MQTNFKPHERVRRYETNFSPATRELFTWNYECWECFKNHWDCLHHILGGEFPSANSPLNAAPLNNAKCHIGNGHYFTDQQKEKYLFKTYTYLKSQGYSLTKNDYEFIKEVKKRLGIAYGELVLTTSL